MTKHRVVKFAAALVCLCGCSLIVYRFYKVNVDLAAAVGREKWLKWEVVMTRGETYRIVDSKLMQRRTEVDRDTVVQRFSVREKSEDGKVMDFELVLQLDRFSDESGAAEKYWLMRKSMLSFSPHNPELKNTRGWEHLIVQPGEMRFWAVKKTYYVRCSRGSIGVWNPEVAHLFSIVFADALLRGLEGKPIAIDQRELNNLPREISKLGLGYRDQAGAWRDYVEAKDLATDKSVVVRRDANAIVSNHIDKRIDGFDFLGRLLPGWMRTEFSFVSGAIGVLSLLSWIWLKIRRTKNAKK